MVDEERVQAGSLLVEHAPEALARYLDRFCPLIVILFDAEGRIFGCNAAFAELMGRADCRCDQLITSIVECEQIEQLLPRGSETFRQVRLTVTGEGGDHLLKATVIRIQDGYAIVGATPHVTDQSAMNEMSSVNNDLSNITRELHRKNRELEKAKAEIERLARTDGLTGLLNRQHFMAELDRAVSATRRHRRHLAVVMADLDHFKRINDTFGHQAGDAALERFSGLLAGNSRKEDILCRYGGEEFICAMPDTDRESATAFAERVRLALAETTIPRIDARITASFGVAPLQTKDTPHSLIKRADEALYAAKDAGRNRVSIAETRAAVG